MRTSWELLMLTTALFGNVNGQLTTSTLRHNSTSSTQSLAPAVTTLAPSQTLGLSPCGRVSSSLSYLAAAKATTAYLNPIDCMACLWSIPLHVERSLDFINYVAPFLEFQSTLAYLKNPPIGYPMAGVDLLGGLQEIRTKVKNIDYNNQYEFERQLYSLVNIRPRDFHLNLPLPLIDLFAFSTPDEASLGSISSDGKALPGIYFVLDLAKARALETVLTWKPSPLVTINGRRAEDYVLRAGLESQQWADPDAIYNRMFVTPALSQTDGGNSWVSGGHIYGFPSAATTYVFANQTTIVLANRATSIYGASDFVNVTTGEELFRKFEMPADATSLETRDTLPHAPNLRIEKKQKRAATTTVTSVEGYPTPVLLSEDGSTGGYFIPNSKTAVLVMTSFEGSDTAHGVYFQQNLVKTFLAKCKAAKMTKLIVDLQANGGGYIFNGEDTFVQLFPNLQLLGVTRTRWTPMIDTLSKMYATAGPGNNTFSSNFQYQQGVDVNLQNFKSAQDYLGPHTIYGDNFTSIVRTNTTDQDEEIGVPDLESVAAQLFSADNIVLLYDGLCGSTCSIFSELMTAVAGVRSVVVGGRPMSGPMQTVAGSRGAQVLSYGELASDWVGIKKYYKEHDLTVPVIANASQYTIPVTSKPLDVLQMGTRARVNLRNNYNSTSSSEIPLQFRYEPANCRLYWQVEDLFSMLNLWQKVEDVTWGKGKCVAGSSVMADDTMPQYAWQLREYEDKSFTNFTLNGGLPGTVYHDVNDRVKQVVVTIGQAINQLWA